MLSITLKVEESDVELVTKLLDEQKSVLRSWLLSHLSDKTMQEIRDVFARHTHDE